MAWCVVGARPLSEPMMVRLPTHICVTRPQWVDTSSVRGSEYSSVYSYHMDNLASQPYQIVNIYYCHTDGLLSHPYDLDWTHTHTEDFNADFLISENYFLQKLISDQKINFWYQKIIFWYQKLFSDILKMPRFSDIRNYFLISEIIFYIRKCHDFLISEIVFWYQKIIFWYQKIVVFSDIRK